MIVFENPGLMDLKGITTFGVSVKETESPIGEFGTGLKYAIAVILRGGGKVELVVGGEIYSFEVQKDAFRGQEQDFIYMNGQQLPFTTHLGKNWEPWMAFRELLCNAQDEGGDVRVANDDEDLCLKPYDLPSTKIIVTWEKFDEVYTYMGSFFIGKRLKPIVSLMGVDIYSGPSKGVFYRGILVKELDEKPSLYKYNLLSAQTLTEDRTLKYDYAWRLDVSRALQLADTGAAHHVIMSILNATKVYLESDFSFDTTAAPSMVGATFSAAFEELEQRDMHINFSAVRWYQSMVARKIGIKPASTTALQRRILNRAVSRLLSLGYPVTKYEIIVTNQLAPENLGLAADGKIYLASNLFEKGVRMVATTLLEEYVHLQYGVQDMTRSMQDVLLDQVINIAEGHIWNEPI